MGVALVVGLCVSLTAQAPAVADPVIPSTGQIAQARQAAATKAQQAGAIKAELADAQADLDRTQIAMATAGQAYDAALLKLDAARATLRKAQAANRAAQAEVATAQRAVGALVRSQVQGDAGLLQWASLLNGATPQDLIDQASVFNTVSASLDGLKRKLVKAQQVAAARQQAATTAEAAVQQAAKEAADSKAAAERAADLAQQTVSDYASRRDQLLVELARAEQVTVSLVRQRQAGLEALARARAEAKRRAAEAAMKRREAARRAAEARAAAAARARAAAAAERARKARAAARSHASRPSPSRPSHSSAPRRVAAPIAHHGYSRSAAQHAIAFARSQIGKPYVFGATGPGSYDCSGLTMRAWEAAGRGIPRLAASQYFATQHISSGDLRPGDLLFWGSSPSSIYHVALYIGNGKMIQAPRPGRSVEVQSVYYWISPSYFGRV
ncbi:C40 family peptidase [Microlunatus ginsengisoli]|uniref:NlpC/P60 domain-containing protein n=1 Tax=Microlunatus ginsengisoli TaxID=363863 RepID=A0ABP6ZJR6_9ACTN